MVLTEDRLMDSQERSAAGHKDSDFAQLHDLARHTIHTCEILAVACDTVTELLGEYRPNSGLHCQCSAGSALARKINCPHNDMAFRLRLLQNFRSRAESLRARLSNEISLVGFAWTLRDID